MNSHRQTAASKNDTFDMLLENLHDNCKPIVDAFLIDMGQMVDWCGVENYGYSLCKFFSGYQLQSNYEKGKQ